VDDVVEGLQTRATHVRSFLREEVHRTFLAGNILPAMEKLILTPEKFRKICKTLGQVTDWQDFLFLITLAYGTVPLFKYPYTTLAKGNKKPFQKTGYFMVSHHFQQISKIALLCYLVDMLKVVIIEMGFTWGIIPVLPIVFARSAYTVWAARKLSLFKKWMLCRLWHRSPETLGRMELIDHLGDAFILTVAFLVVVDILSFELGFAVKSIFAFGSIGTLVFSLASQGIVANLMNGLLLSASDRVYEGDSVKFGNGLEGTVVKMGWIETVIRGSDEIMMTVPNSDLASQQLANLSRLLRCQIKQTLRFSYKDVDKLSKVCDDIKAEIRKACPELITDGTRAFRCHWIGYEEDHLSVMVQAHFRIRPLGSEYWVNRQRVLEAISRAVEKNDVEFEIQSS
jgi:small-conductance mechanosensitive channel